MKIFYNHEPKTVVQEQPQQAIYTQTPETQERDEVLSGNISSAPKQYVQPRQVLTPLNQNQPPTRVGNGIKEQDGVIDYGSGGGNKFAEEGEKEKWYADWEKTPFMDAIRSNNRAIYDNWGNYNEWAKENGKEPLDVFTVMRALQDKDGNKSFEEFQSTHPHGVRQYIQQMSEYHSTKLSNLRKSTKWNDIKFQFYTTVYKTLKNNKCEPPIFYAIHEVRIIIMLYNQFTSKVHSKILTNSLYSTFPVIPQKIKSHTVLLFINNTLQLIFKDHELSFCKHTFKHRVLNPFPIIQTSF